MAGRKIVTEKLEKAVEWVPGQVEQVKSYCIAPIIAGRGYNWRSLFIIESPFYW